MQLCNYAISLEEYANNFITPNKVIDIMVSFGPIGALAKLTRMDDSLVSNELFDKLVSIEGKVTDILLNNSFFIDKNIEGSINEVYGIISSFYKKSTKYNRLAHCPITIPSLLNNKLSDQQIQYILLAIKKVVIAVDTYEKRCQYLNAFDKEYLTRNPSIADEIIEMIKQKEKSLAK